MSAKYPAKSRRNIPQSVRKSSIRTDPILNWDLYWIQWVVRTIIFPKGKMRRIITPVVKIKDLGFADWRFFFRWGTDCKTALFCERIQSLTELVKVIRSYWKVLVIMRGRQRPTLNTVSEQSMMFITNTVAKIKMVALFISWVQLNRCSGSLTFLLFRMWNFIVSNKVG